MVGTGTVGGSASRRFTWDTVVMNLVVPELAYGAFIDAAVGCQSWLTLYAHVCQQLYACRGTPDTERAVTDGLVSWIARARPQNAADALAHPEKLLLLVRSLSPCSACVALRAKALACVDFDLFAIVCDVTFRVLEAMLRRPER